MLTESDRGSLIASLRNVNYYVSGLDLLPLENNVQNIMRMGEDYPREENFIAVDFLPSSVKHGVGLDNFDGYRENPIYKDYGYGEEETCVIRTFTRNSNGIHGRIIGNEWMDRLEKYIRYTWNDIIRGHGSIAIETFTPPTNIPNYFAQKLYVYELGFIIRSHHGWSDEPMIGGINTEISGVELNSIVEVNSIGLTGIQVWVSL